MSEFGLMMAGGVSVPLSVKLLGEEIPFRLNHTDAKAIFTTKNQLKKVLGSFGRVENKAIRVVYLDDDPDAARAAAAEFGVSADRLVGFDEARAAGRAAMASISASLDRSIEAVGEDDTVTICYTSGTTGNPKGIMLTHLNYWTNCHDGVEVIRIPEGWRSLIILPVDHSFAHTAGLYTAMVCCIALYFLDTRGGGIAALRNIPINLLETNPHFLFTVPALSGNFMKKIIAGVEEKGGIIEKLFKAGIRAGIAWNGNGFDLPPFLTRLRAFLPYAVARALVFKTVARKVFGTSGVLMPSIEVKIVKADGSEAAVGETGEIVMRGGSVMKGYFKNPEATAKALRDGWLYTGDLACIDEDRFLVVVGREKALLIAEDGEKYSPEEIEEAVTFSTDTIDQIMAWCDQKKYTTALVTLDTGKVERLAKARGIGTTGDLLKALQEEFVRYKADPKAKKVQSNWMPAVFQIVPEAFSDKDGTVNSTMKIVRHRIVELHRDLIDYSYTAEGSKTVNARNLAALRAMFKLA